MTTLLRIPRVSLKVSVKCVSRYNLLSYTTECSQAMSTRRSTGKFSSSASKLFENINSEPRNGRSFKMTQPVTKFNTLYHPVQNNISGYTQKNFLQTSCTYNSVQSCTSKRIIIITINLARPDSNFNGVGNRIVPLAAKPRTRRRRNWTLKRLARSVGSFASKLVSLFLPQKRKRKRLKHRKS